MKKIKRDEIKEKVLDLSCGLLASTIDLALFCVFQGINLGESEYGAIGARKATEASTEDVLACGINSQTIKRAIWKATHQKFIKRSKTNKNFFEITHEGLARLNSKIPLYKEKRPWDKHLYLVIYDIPEEEGRKRRILRDYLRKIGCGMLQASVWLTLYNPKGVLEKLIKEHDLPGSIIVADVGEKGSIGEEDLDDLVSRVYHLEDINERYKEFIKELKQPDLNKTQAYFLYLSILKDDPQLPFEILPYNWLGDKAHQYFTEAFLS